MVELDGFGKPCPMPLVMCKKEIDAGNTSIAIRVDNDTAVKNITRLAKKKGLGFTVADIEGGFLIQMGGELSSEESQAPAAAPAACSIQGGACGYSVFIGKDHVGDGDPELGCNLMKMAIYTLAESDDVPSSVLFMNSGVQLVAGEEPQVVESCNKLIERGCEILVCGTCLNFYGITDKLEVGEVSNMYDILSRMQEAGKTITL